MSVDRRARIFFLLSMGACGTLLLMPARRYARSDSLGKICLGTLLAFSLLVASLLSTAPALHEQLHRDSATTSHLCVVTLFASGHCESATVAPVLAAPAALPTDPAPLSFVSFRSATRLSSILEHAPPSFA